MDLLTLRHWLPQKHLVPLRASDLQNWVKQRNWLEYARYDVNDH
jgi:hypothetical protein